MKKKLSKAYLKYYVLCTSRLNANFMHGKKKLMKILISVTTEIKQNSLFGIQE